MSYELNSRGNEIVPDSPDADSLTRTSLSGKQKTLPSHSGESSDTKSIMKKVVSFARRLTIKLPSNSSEETLKENNVFKGKLDLSTSNNSSFSSREIGVSNGSGLLEKISEADEESQSEFVQDYYGWDGYEARFGNGEKDDLSQESIPKCIPPWAKTVRKKYGLISPSGSMTKEDQSNIQERIENLMRKHNELMLVKRVENRKQLTLEPGKCDSDIDVIKMRAKNTRYYMAPLTKSDGRKFIVKSGTDNNTKERRSATFSDVSEYDSNENRMSVSKKTSRLQAKRELSNVLKTDLYKKQDEIKKHDASFKKDPSIKCPKITLSKIREYIDAQAMDPDERKLHEIIKVERVPSVTEQNRGKPGSKYIINVPLSKTNDQGTVNIIKIKEKRKLRVHSIEDIEEKTTELQYGECASLNTRGRSHEPQLENETERVTKKVKSPNETKTFQVTSKKTPRITPLVEQNEKKEKVLLMQYEKKTKSGKTKHKERRTQLLGIKQPDSDSPGEMYLYNSEMEGGKVKEKVTKVDDVPATLNDKVNSIFQELKDLTFKKPEVTTSEIQVHPFVSSKSTQHFPQKLIDTEVQIMPEQRSTEIQVSQSQLLWSESFLKVPPPTPESVSTAVEEEKEKIDDQEEEEKEKTDDTKEDLKSITSKVSPDPRSSGAELKAFQDKTDATDKEAEEKNIEDENIESNTQDDEDLEETEDNAIPAEKLSVEDEVIETKEDDKDTDYKQTDEGQKIKKGVTFEAVEEQSKDIESEVDAEELKEKELDSKEPVLSEETKQVESDSKTETLKETESKEHKPSQTEAFLTLKEDEVNKDTLVIQYVREEDKLTEGVSETSDENDKTSDETLLKTEHEDIYSYDFHPDQATDLMHKSSSKFLHNKASVRKMMDWTDDTLYLETELGPSLIRGLAETAVRRPADPVTFLAHWMYKARYNQQREHEEQVQEEHRLLARDMDLKDMPAGQGDTLKRKKFSVRKYPVNKMNERSSEVTVKSD